MPTNQTYQIFTRTQWKKNPNWPNGKEPHFGRKKIIGYVDSVEKAREICEEWNNTHNPGPLSRKAEFTSDYKK